MNSFPVLTIYSIVPGGVVNLAIRRIIRITTIIIQLHIETVSRNDTLFDYHSQTGCVRDLLDGDYAYRE